MSNFEGQGSHKGKNETGRDGVFRSAGRPDRDMPLQNHIRQDPLNKPPTEEFLKGHIQELSRQFGDDTSIRNLQSLNVARGELADRLLENGDVMQAKEVLLKGLQDAKRVTGKAGELDWYLAKNCLFVNLARCEKALGNEEKAQEYRFRAGIEASTADAEIAKERIIANSINIKQEIDRYGQDLGQWLMNAIAENQVLAIGEIHHGKVDGQRNFVARMMRDLKKAGCTHLALELPSSRQDILDNFMLTGQSSYDLKSYEAESGDLFVYKSWFETPALRGLMNSARQAGLKLVAVDVPRKPYNEDPDELVFEPRRDNYMATQVESLLKDEHAKVIFWGGADHAGERKTNWWHAAMAKTLSDKGIRVASIAPAAGIAKELAEPSLSKWTSEIKKPIAIPTDKARKLGQLPRYMTFKADHKLNSWDAVILMPEEKK